MNLENDKNVFELFSSIRNGIHTNYVFYPLNQKNKKIKYKGIDYDLIVGKRMKFINLDTINIVTIGIIEVLTKIVKHDKILQIPKIPRLINE